MRKDELLNLTLANLAKKGVVMDGHQLAKVIEVFLLSIKEAVIGGQHIEIRGFGTYSVRDRSNRTAWNPVLKQKFTVQGKKVPYFKPGTIFKKEVLQGKLMGEGSEPSAG